MVDESFSEAKPRHARHIILYLSPAKFIVRGLGRTTEGRPELVLEAGDVSTIRLDFARMMDVDEIITEATATPTGIKANFTNYSGQEAYLTVEGGCGSVNVSIKTSNSERFTDRIEVRPSASIGGVVLEFKRGTT